MTSNSLGEKGEGIDFLYPDFLCRVVSEHTYSTVRKSDKEESVEHIRLRMLFAIRMSLSSGMCAHVVPDWRENDVFCIQILLSLPPSPSERESDMLVT